MEAQNSTSAIGQYWDFLFTDLAGSCRHPTLCATWEIILRFCLHQILGQMTGHWSGLRCRASPSSGSTSTLSTPGDRASWKTANHSNSKTLWLPTTSFRFWSACISSPRWVDCSLVSRMLTSWSKLFSSLCRAWTADGWDTTVGDASRLTSQLRL